MRIMYFVGKPADTATPFANVHVVNVSKVRRVDTVKWEVLESDDTQDRLITLSFYDDFTWCISFGNNPSNEDYNVYEISNDSNLYKLNTFADFLETWYPVDGLVFLVKSERVNHWKVVDPATGETIGNEEFTAELFPDNVKKEGEHSRRWHCPECNATVYGDSKTNVICKRCKVHFVEG